MIYFITGVSSVGKSTLCELLEKKLPTNKYRFIDFDKKMIGLTPKRRDDYKDTAKQWADIILRSSEEDLIFVVFGVEHYLNELQTYFSQNLTIKKFYLKIDESTMRARLNEKYREGKLKPLRECWNMSFNQYAEEWAQYLKAHHSNKIHDQTIIDVSKHSVSETAEILLKHIGSEIEHTQPLNNDTLDEPCCFCGFPYKKNDGCNYCGLDKSDQYTIKKTIYGGWNNPAWVYTGSTDSAKVILSALDTLSKNKISNIDCYYSVAGGMSGLHYLSLLTPQNIVLFDANPHALLYAEMFIELIKNSESIHEFLEKLYCRDISAFLKKFRTLTFGNQFNYLYAPFSSEIYAKTIKKLPFQHIETYNRYLSPFHTGQNIKDDIRIRNFLPCWDIDMEIPMGDWHFSVGRLKGHRLPPTGSLFYGYGWLSHNQTFLEVKNKLQKATINFVCANVYETLSYPIVKAANQVQSVVYHFSNIFDDFLKSDKALVTNLITSTDWKPSGSVLSAVIHSKTGCTVVKDFRKYIDHFNKRFKKNAYSYLDSESFAAIYTELADIIENRLNALSVLDVGCYNGVLLKRLNKLAYYCGIDSSDYILKKCAKIAKPFPVNLICGNFLELPTVQNRYDVIYFGGILSTIRSTNYQSEFEMLKKYCNKYRPKFIIWQEAEQYYSLNSVRPYLKQHGYDELEFITLTTTLPTDSTKIGDGVEARMIGNKRSISVFRVLSEFI